MSPDILAAGSFHVILKIFFFGTQLEKTLYYQLNSVGAAIPFSATLLKARFLIYIFTFIFSIKSTLQITNISRKNLNWFFFVKTDTL